MGSYMDSLEAEYSLLRSVNGAVSSFNELFDTIAPITFDENEVKTSNKKSVELDVLTCSQSTEIRQLSKYLADLRDYGQRSVLLHIRANRLEVTPLAADDYARTEIKFLKSKIMEIQSEDVKKAKVIATLTTFLINETNRANDVEKVRCMKETMLVDMTVLRDNYKKLYMKQLSINSDLKKRGIDATERYRKKLSISVKNADCLYSDEPNTPSSSDHENNMSMYTDTDENDKNESISPIFDNPYQGRRKELIGVHIRKQFEDDFFFGLIVCYEKPFYKVSLRTFTVFHHFQISYNWLLMVNIFLAFLRCFINPM